MILRLSMLQPNNEPSIPVVINVDNVTEIYEQFEDKKFHHTNVVFCAMGGEQPLFTSVEERMDVMVSRLGKIGQLINLRDD